jgi:copper chaperone CopZ
MNRRTMLGLMAASLLPQVARAADTRTTTIQIQNMHCPACAQKIANKLYAVPSVVSVKTNHTAGTAVVQPSQTKDASPRAMWEAVEKAGFKPVKLTGPSGVYTAKPNA